MKCSKCEKEIAVSARFCPDCGSSIKSRWRSCANTQCGRTDLPEEALFCLDCGIKLVSCNPEGSKVNPKGENTLNGSSGTIDDPRDGHEYKWVRIGTQIWMAENLAFKMDTGCCAYKNKQENVLEYGYLYNWEVAFEACRPGWHLPSKEEWDILENFLLKNGYHYKSKKDAIAKALASSSGWKNSFKKGSIGYIQSNNNKSGFNAKPGGWFSDRNFYSRKEAGYWWTSSPFDYNQAYGNLLFYGGIWLLSTEGNKDLGYSVRCIKD